MAEHASNERKTTMAAARLCATDSGYGALAVSLCLLHDLLAVAAFLASHPLHAVYLLLFVRHLLSVAAFFWPLLVSTSLLLAVLVTVGPYLGGAEWPGVRSLGRTCCIAVAVLCTELRPDCAGCSGGIAGLVEQLCSFVLGPDDAAAILRVEEIMGELCDISGSCFVLDLDEEKSLLLLDGDECNELAFELPLIDDTICEKSILNHENFGEIKDEIDDKVVISEESKSPNSLAEQCCPSVTMLVQEMKAEEEVNVIQEQGLVLSDKDEVSDGVKEKRLECDPVSVEIKKPETMESMEIKKFEHVEPMEIDKYKPVESMKIKKLEPVESMEIKKLEPVEPMEVKRCELAKRRSSVASRIKLWEAQVSSNIKPVVEDKEDNSVEFSLDNQSFKDVKKCEQYEADPCDTKCGSEQHAQEVASVEQPVEQEQGQEFKDVREYMHSEAEFFSEKCSQDVQTEESVPDVAQAEQELQGQDCQDVQPEPVLQEQVYKILQSEQDLQEREEYKDVTQSPVMCNERENPLKSTSIAGRVHSRTSSDNLVSEGSPLQKEKEWKRTLACKLYEERMQLRLCRDRAVVEGSDNMDMLWEAYEVGSGSNGIGKGAKRGSGKAKGGAIKQDELVEEGKEEEEEADDNEEGSVRQLCCLQALKFSTKKMNFGGGKPSLAKISKVLKRMTALSRVGSRRSQKS
ncbi:uncharacterized protein LOC133899879 [Phragmites australis]|uniref:uncharacterized protein LOC133899879 n=1 Tax=Phragmites australis TaxID=29695 RepID=UPI002D77982C|nr:uncharacterized protein LOC133899879 [Phragmites australis]